MKARLFIENTLTGQATLVASFANSREALRTCNFMQAFVNGEEKRYYVQEAGSKSKCLPDIHLFAKSLGWVSSEAEKLIEEIYAKR